MTLHALPVPLRFNHPVVLLGGGWVDLALLDRLARAGSPLVAADGGANCLADSDVKPDAIIGDLDSLMDPARWRDRTRLVRLEEQETTDLEKCLYSVEAPRFIGLGFTGRRLDHTLAALHVLLRFAQTKPVVLAGEHDWVWVPRQSVSLHLKPGQRLSLFPLARTAFSHSRGLAYPLDGLVLAPGEAIGTSNAVTASPVELGFAGPADPACAVMLPRAAGDMPGSWFDSL